MTTSSCNSPSPAALSTAPAPLLQPFFIGRDRELQTLRSALDETRTGRGRLMLLVGEPGIGKTRLADELATIARQGERHVLWGRCWEGDGAPAFWPWVQIVRAYLSSCNQDALIADLGAEAAMIAQIVTEVQTRLPNLPTPPELEPEQARFRFFDGLAHWMHRASQRQPLVLILDDLHWADTPSLLLLQFFAHEVHNAHVLIIGAYRDTDIDREHPLSATLGVLARDSQRLELTGLAEKEVSRFLQETTGLVPSPNVVSFVHKQTEGNPFFLSELVRLLDAEGRLSPTSPPDALTRGRIPQGVRNMIRLRLKQLSPQSLPVLTVAAVIGREFTLEVLTHASRTWAGITWDAILSALQESSTARILGEAASEQQHYRFTHALIRETLYEDTPLPDRVQLHRHVGEAIETLYRTSVQPHLPALADHFFKAAPGGDAAKAVQYATGAAERAAALLAYEEAALDYTRALHMLALTDANEEQRCNLLLALGEMLSSAGETQQSRETFLQAAAIARKLRAQENSPRLASVLARAALGLGAMWFVPGTGVVNEPLVNLLEESREALGATESPLRARVLARLAAEQRWFSSPRERRAALSEEAVTMARSLGDEATLRYTLSAWNWVLWEPANVEERVAATSEIIRLAEKGGDHVLTLVGRTWRSIAFLELGERRRSDDDVTVVFGLAEKLRQPFYLWWATGQRTLHALLEGRLEEAEQHIYQQFQFGQQVQAPDTLQAFGIQMAILRNAQGRLQEMESAFKEFVDQYPTVPAWRCGLAGLYRELEQTAQAREVFEQIAAHDFTDLPHDSQWMTAMVLLSDVCAFLHDTRRAAQLYTLLLPYANRVAIIGPGTACYGSINRNLALLAATQSRWREASTHFDAALTHNERIGAKPFLVRTQYEYAQMLMTRGSPHDHDRARSLLDSALATARTLGFSRLEENIQAQRAKSEKPVASSPPPPPQDPELSPRRSGLETRDSALSAQRSELSTQHSQIFRPEGEYWTISYEGTTSRLRFIKGFLHLACLLREPGREFHVLDLLAMTDREGALQSQAHDVEATRKIRLPDTAPVPDQQARANYRQRLQSVRSELVEAEQLHDIGRMNALRAEEQLLTQELSAAYGVGHHARARSETVEKARKAVAYRIRAALEKIKKANPALWRHLFLTIKTGVFCSYNPEKPTAWRL